MIRGSIDFAGRTQVAGWIHAEPLSVRDRTVLAFVGDRCVGSGKVDRFRKDLFDAKLGDGQCGFEFTISLTEGDCAASVIVKLEGSDVALIQRDARPVDIESAIGLRPEIDLGAVGQSMMSWMQARGWLEQHEYDFLRAVKTIGAYERGLRPARRLNAEMPPLLKPDAVAMDALSLYVMGEIDVVINKVASIAELGDEESPMRGPGISLMAMWSNERCRIALEERSHMREANAPGCVRPSPAPGAAELSFGPDRMLFLHRQASFAPVGLAPRGGITVFTARHRDSVAAFAARRENRAA